MKNIIIPHDIQSYDSIFFSLAVHQLFTCFLLLWLRNLGFDFAVITTKILTMIS